MPNNSHIDMVARHLRDELGARAFLTIPRTSITEDLRRVSAEPRTRIKARLARDLTTALERQGVSVYPPLATTTTGDTVRLYHTGSIVGQLVDLLVVPTPERDRELGAMVLKIKGKWRYKDVDGERPTVND